MNTRFISFLFWPYRWILSPVLHTLMPGTGCRYTPTCSVYAAQALGTFPLHRALILIVHRLLRCHPWARGGEDPLSGSTSGGLRDNIP